MGVKLVGDVSNSYGKIQMLSIPTENKDFSIEEFKFNQDIEKVMTLELRAHRAEPSSVVHNLPKRHWTFFRDFLKQLSKSKTAFVLKSKGKIIGFVGYNIREEIPSGAFVASVSIDPKFKGQGLSKLMYLKILSEMKSRKIKQFYGYSKTEQVLSFSKKIGRRPCYYSFKLDGMKLQSL
jgi:L-amino acid N-acyltransferase YncA